MVTQIVLASTRSILTLPDKSLLLAPATITISPTTGHISSIVPAVLPPSSFPAGTTYINHSPHILLPGLVDAHVHLNEPGRTAWEGFETGTRAAAAGGVTTVVDMPLNSVPPTTTVQGLKAKTNAAKGKCWVDVAFYGGIVPGNAGELKALVDAGVRGFKGFLIDSGVDEFPAVSTKDVEATMIALKDIPTTLMFHAEMEPSLTETPSSSSPSAAAAAAAESTPAPPTSYETFLNSRPPTFETRAISSILALAPLAPKLHLHIVHLSATEAIPLLRDARARGVNITAETCFHYLELQAEDIPDGDTRHKCCPPIRSRENRDALWAELARPDSCIRTVVSDHSPCTPELKNLPRNLCADAGGGDGGGTSGVAAMSSAATGSAESLADSGIDVSSRTYSPQPAKPSNPAAAVAAAAPEAPNAGDFMAAWGGISSVGLGLPILHTNAAERGLRLHDIVRLCAQETARQVGLAHRKGGLKVGLDADICVFDDSEEWTLTRDEMRWRNKCSPWEGRRFRGRVRETWVRGRKVWDGEGLVGPPEGELILERRTV